MSSTFMSDDFLLHSEFARELYYEHAAKSPIYDYHCHLIPQQVADDVQFSNLTQAWLYGDHYKWRAMRSNGVAERYCTGDASDYEKFEKWAETVPHCLRNPLYHWTHLELKSLFGITGKLFGPDTAKEIYDTCSEMLNSPEFTVRNIMRKMNVKLVCTTDDPLDSLEYHKQIAADGFEVKVYPTWRPDKGIATENVAGLNEWIDSLASLTDIEINSFAAYIEAIGVRHGFFHEAGCRMSDHGLETAYAEDYTQAEIDGIFDKIRSGKDLDWGDQLKFKSAMIYEFGIMDHAKGWVQQFHFGPIRSNSSRLFKQVGADTGFDSIGDEPIAKALAKMLDRLDRENRLAKTILYNINPRDNELMATMIGNFQDGSVPGKMQFGSGWWFMDQKDGMTRQINALSNLGLLSRFVGMLTDSRSLLSYPRHEYFRRILCNIIGNDVVNGELPDDMGLLGTLVENVSYKNAVEYFPMEV